MNIFLDPSNNKTILKTPYLSFVSHIFIPSEESITNLLLLPFSRNSSEFISRAKKNHIINLSFLYAFNNGDIGFYGSGRIPIRKNPIMGAFIKDGTVTENDWISFVLDDQNP